LVGGFRATHGVAGEVETVGVVDQSVEDGVGVGGVADESVPVGDGYLTGDEGGFARVTVFEDFEKIVAGLRVEWFESPVVEDRPSRSVLAVLAA
jgi:hypothetical protein